MSSKEVLGKIIELDADGNFLHYTDWNKDMAPVLAMDEGIATLSEGHWKVINFMRAEYEKNEVSPTLRRITKQSGVNTKEMYELFPKGPAKKAAKIAGLPKPKGCI